MKKSALILLFLLTLGCFPLWAQASVGVATDVQGTATLTRDHQFFLLEEGVEINSRDIIHTGSDSSIQLDMDDGSIISLGSNSHIALSQYKIHRKKRGIAATVNLVSGWLRFAVAKLVSFDSHYRFTTSTAVLGVRGTEGLINVEGQGVSSVSSLLLESGKIIMAESVRGNALSGQLVTVNPGEFASRNVGRKIIKQAHAPSSFIQRIPARLKSPLKHRSTKLRGTKPKPILGLKPAASGMHGDKNVGLTQPGNSQSSPSEGLLYKVFNKGDKPKVKAELSYTGSGILRGVWEIAEPSSTSGTPIFHPLTHERKFLGQIGQVTVYSPQLPSNMTGLYMVRFRITDPATAFTSPIIRYFVTAGKGAPKPSKLQLISPAHREKYHSNFPLFLAENPSITCVLTGIVYSSCGQSRTTCRQ